MSLFHLDTPLKRWTAAVISGVMLHFVVGLEPWWPMAWIAPIPLLLAALPASRSETRLLCLTAGLIGQAGNFSYYVEVTGAVPAVMVTLLQALEWVLVVGLTRAIARRSQNWISLFIYPVLWAALDTLIATFSPHGSWGSLAYTQMNVLPVIQIASFTGTAGVVFLVGLFASSVAVGLYPGLKMKRPLLAYGLSGAVLVAALAYGCVRPSHPSATGTIPVGLVTIDDYIGPGVPIETADAVWSRYDEELVRLAGQGARIIVFPEKIATLDAAAADEKRRHWELLAKDHNVYLLVGVALSGSGGKSNAAWLFAPTGRLAATYCKQQLVPHLEADFIPGHEDVVCSLDGHQVGLAICRDLFFPGLARRYGSRGIQAMLVPAWDFNRDGWLESRTAILRGVESGYTVIRCGRESLLTVSDCYGHVVAQARSRFLPGTSLLCSAPLMTGRPTPYVRFGNVFGWLCVVLSLVLGRRRMNRGQ